MMRDAISLVVEGHDLTVEQSSAVMREMMRGKATAGQVGAFAVAMRMKGETEDEIYGLARAMREAGASISSPPGSIDICGTGGDGLRTFNISTAATFVIGSAGVPVAKHGNRSISSSSGSADVLAALGIPHDLCPSSVEQCLSITGMGFMFAPTFHSSMGHVMGPRRDIGIRTFFNMLGPLANPCAVDVQLIGVYDPSKAVMMAKVLNRLGSRRVMVVHGSGMDEITLTGGTQVVEMIDGAIDEYTISPEDFDMAQVPVEELQGGSPLENARMMLSVLQGERSPRSDIVALNAGAGLYIAGRAGSMKEGVEMSRGLLRSGQALDKLRKFSETCLRLEGSDQMRMDAAALVQRRIVPTALVERCEALSSQLLSQIRDAGLEDILGSMDKELLRSPNVLTYILLRRALDIHSSAIPEVEHRGSEQRLSRMISSSEGVAVIGEYKPRSPSTNNLGVPPSTESAVAAYQTGGAAGISVLMEPELFGGGPGLFSSIRSRVHLPMLFKDFVISPRQLEMARCLGADAVLLMASALDGNALDEMVVGCLSKGMEPLVEVHSSDDIDKLRGIPNYDKVEMVGANCRDLRTLEVRIHELAGIRSMLDPDKLCIAESGVRSIADLDHLRGFDGVLIGSMFMGSPDIATSAMEIVTRCREVRA